MIGILNKRFDGVPPGAMYCGRPSILGNPFIIPRDGTREEVVAKYRSWFYDNVDRPDFQAALARAEKATYLVCWCAPELCHLSVIVEYLEKRREHGKAT